MSAPHPDLPADVVRPRPAVIPLAYAFSRLLGRSCSDPRRTASDPDPGNRSGRSTGAEPGSAARPSAAVATRPARRAAGTTSRTGRPAALHERGVPDAGVQRNQGIGSLREYDHDFADRSLVPTVDVELVSQWWARRGEAILYVVDVPLEPRREVLVGEVQELHLPPDNLQPTEELSDHVQRVQAEVLRIAVAAESTVDVPDSALQIVCGAQQRILVPSDKARSTPRLSRWLPGWRYPCCWTTSTSTAGYLPPGCAACWTA